MLRRLLRSLFTCQHSETYRERRDGVLHLCCHWCGHATPVQMGDRAKIRKLQAQWHKSRAWRAEKPPAEVYVMPRIRRKEGT